MDIFNVHYTVMQIVPFLQLALLIILGLTLLKKKKSTIILYFFLTTSKKVDALKEKKKKKPLLSNMGFSGFEINNFYTWPSSCSCQKKKRESYLNFS